MKRRTANGLRGDDLVEGEVLAMGDEAKNLCASHTRRHRGNFYCNTSFEHADKTATFVCKSE